MKKTIILSLIIFISLMITGCGTQEMTFVSEPVGYALMSDTYVAKASFEYRSNEQYNINKVSMELYYLPSVWGEIEMGLDQQLSVEDPNILIIDYNSPNQKIYAKYIQIGTTNWTAEIDNGNVKYVNENNINILELLVDEEEAKGYIESLEFRQSSFMQHDGGFLFDYYSKLDPTNAGIVYKVIPAGQVLNMRWGEVLSSFPDLSTYYPDFDSTNLNTLFQRVFAKAEEEEFITVKTYSK